MFGFRYIIIFLSLFLFLQPLPVGASVLAPNQATWLTKHENTIIVRPEQNYPPFVFVSSRPSIKPKGLAVDYIELVARKVGAQETYLEAKPRSVIVSEIKSGKEGIILALSETDENSNYLYFSEPFITLPAVIVTRKDFKPTEKELSLADFNAKQVAVTEGYGAMDYVKNNYQRIIIEPVSDDEVGLQKLLLGEVDAAVMDLASLSYYTSNDMLSYVRVAGQTGFEYKLSFAVPKSMPDLQVILNAGLKEITPSERAIIKDRWITFQSKQENLNKSSFTNFSVGTPLWIGISVGATIIILILLFIIIFHNRRHHKYHVASLSRSHEKEKKVSHLTRQLEELENANSVLGENVEEIKNLEKAIQEKIEHIND
jgi:ABC-type amino acid transport substrate-binding protein